MAFGDKVIKREEEMCKALINPRAGLGVRAQDNGRPQESLLGKLDGMVLHVLVPAAHAETLSPYQECQKENLIHPILSPKHLSVKQLPMH